MTTALWSSARAGPQKSPTAPGDEEGTLEAAEGGRAIEEALPVLEAMTHRGLLPDEWAAVGNQTFADGGGLE